MVNNFFCRWFWSCVVSFVPYLLGFFVVGFVLSWVVWAIRGGVDV